MTEEVKVARERRRQQRRAEKAETPKTSRTQKTYWVQIRMFPIWLRILLILAIFGGAATAGLMVGYGILGDGSPSDALKWGTYQHLLDIKNGN